MKKNRLFFIKIILICLCVFALMPQNALAMKKSKPVEIEIKSYDGFKIGGMLDIPGYASIETKAPLVIFLHSICKDHRAWGDLSERTKNFLNVATLNLDLRGHGLSVKDKDGKTLHWQNLKLEDFKKMPEDILEVIKFIEKEYPEIDHKKVAIVSASLGATVGLMAASYEGSEKIETMIMFSPLLKYKGFDLRLPVVKYGKHPILLIASEKDRYAYDSSKELMKFLQGEKKFAVYPYGGHGEDLLRFQPKSADVVVEWLKDNFTDGKIVATSNGETSEDAKLRNFRYKKVGEYFGKIKKDRDIYGGVH